MDFHMKLPRNGKEFPIFLGIISIEPVLMFFHKWPRNFAIAFGVESLIAQPIARFVMVKIHEAKDKKDKNDSELKAA